jgi:formylglycine-generating enzyme required for sulfatase activity
MQFMKIPSGSFMMGSPESDEKPLRERMTYPTNNQPVHQVTINYSFYMGKYEVTQEQYVKLMGNNPSNRCFDPKCPVDGVSWNAAKEFLGRLNAKDSAYKYRLPSEAEWEYSCRAGTTTIFAFGDGLSSDKANFNGDLPYGGAPKGPYLKEPATIGSYLPNAWGLYDMHGNVSEWCEDFYHDNYTNAPTDGSANEKRGELDSRVERGGNWGNGATYLRSANRNAGAPGTGLSGTGFRIVGIPR